MCVFEPVIDNYNSVEKIENYFKLVHPVLLFKVIKDEAEQSFHPAKRGVPKINK